MRQAEVSTDPSNEPDPVCMRLTVVSMDLPAGTVPVTNGLIDDSARVTDHNCPSIALSVIPGCDVALV